MVFWRAKRARRKNWILTPQTCRKVSLRLRFWRQMIFFHSVIDQHYFLVKVRARTFFRKKKTQAPPPPRISNGPCLITMRLLKSFQILTNVMQIIASTTQGAETELTATTVYVYRGTLGVCVKLVDQSFFQIIDYSHAYITLLLQHSNIFRYIF